MRGYHRGISVLRASYAQVKGKHFNYAIFLLFIKPGAQRFLRKICCGILIA